MKTGTQVLVAATRMLTEAGIEDAGRDARRLLAHAMKVPSSRLTLMLPEPVSDQLAADFESLILRRAAREPVSHLTGRRMFYGREFLVTPDVLDPRPETETLIEAALAEPFGNVLDLGTGSGCILLTLLEELGSMGHHEVWGVGTELSQEAFEVAWWNRNAMGLEERAVLLPGSWFDPLGEAVDPDFGGFDLIVSNPPYVTAAEWEELDPTVRDHEPRMALTDEADGLMAYRDILHEVDLHLAPKGRLLVEIGPEQGVQVASLMVQAGLDAVRIVQDLDGRDRVVIGRKS
ncbi:peptide chain release factor N(5)-glutamine methyltransferase [Pelagovum pacificum]|uniref:Release factor glutamine methyltransferase n=1 Tax=Pelagovum pacificum TaxID=2588711 RepID=A0A5C5GEL6_9RHOB|nr:peptide chain release factor N(5)-glutamine methyltransferase [Pelagovum pacificum]QQA44485.1 peptide chain release factor N(5)-glutamine methyltransferase [Pelagovum pacificum]TNY32399.1 peptide chain release factor N(5)-glutamine methyltransferase [Pelagovum pacificum]